MKDCYKVTRGGHTHLFFNDAEECRVFAYVFLEYIGVDYTLCGLQITIKGEVPWLT